MKDDYNKDRLGKIVTLAKRGEGGEKANAIKMVRSICKKHGLDFEEVMGEGDRVQEYAISWRKKKYENLVIQIILVYAITEEQPIMMNKYRKMYFVKTNQVKYLETLNAIDVLIRLYDKEEERMKEAFKYGFLEKHKLWNPFPSKKKHKPTEEELKARRTGSTLAEEMEDAEIRKRLT